MSIWRALYALTEDVRIPELIVGEVESFIVPKKQKGAFGGGCFILDSRFRGNDKRISHMAKVL
ncbi:MAG: hypothetical protein DRP66_02330 [Planctomycetota bacterium]|nr:MAG: hypothetical protein DRP66_02330 [Planctomycetota bacterium]